MGKDRWTNTVATNRPKSKSNEDTYGESRHRDSSQKQMFKRFSIPPFSHSFNFDLEKFFIGTIDCQDLSISILHLISWGITQK